MLRCHSNVHVSVRPHSDVLLNFLAAGFGVRLEVKVHHPGMEDEVHGREERLGERRAAAATDLFSFNGARTNCVYSWIDSVKLDGQFAACFYM